jgi:simple sugar transport system permease protein
MRYDGFGSLRVIVNLFADNATLGVAAVGMTFVILSGGIDLSIGSVAAFTTVLVANLIGKSHWHPVAAMALGVTLGAAFGWVQGWLIQRYDLPAFLITLGGMFFARGMAFVVTMESVAINNSLYTELQNYSIQVGPKAALPFTGLVLLGMFAIGIFIAHYTVLGRNIYALGGNADSAKLMGLPVMRTRPLVYAISGFCAALAGVVATIYNGSGNPAMGSGMELDAISAVVIGGTLLTGGVGYLAGTLLGVLIFGTIQSALVFDGTLNSSWLRIAVGLLLLTFILLQRFFTAVRK